MVSNFEFGRKAKKMATLGKKKKDGGYHAIIRDVFVCSKTELVPFASVYVYQPENFEQQKFGTLFGVMKVDDHSENSSYVANLLTSQIKKEYFGKLHRSPEESFEGSLRKANLALAELARHGAASWAGKINFAGGAIERNNLHFACLGNVSIFLVRGNEIAEISRELEEEKESEPHPLKTFSNISSGKLEIGDKLIFATNDLTEVFSPEELRQNASHFSQEEFPGFLEVSLQANSILSGTIIVDMAKSPEPKPIIVEAPLIGQEKIKRIDSFVGTAEIPSPAKEEDIYSRDFKSDSHEETSPFAAREVKKISAGLKNIFLGLGDGLKRYFLKMKQSTKDSRFREKFFQLPGKARNVSGKMIPAIRKATYRIQNEDWANRKTIAKIFAVIAIAVLGIYGVIAYIKNRNEQKSSQQSQVTPAETESAPQALEDVNVKNIETLEEVVAFSRGTSRAVLLGNSIFAIPQNGTSILKIDPGSQNVEEIPSNTNSGNFRLAAAMPHLNSLFILTENNKVISFTPINKNFQENSIALPGNLKAADMKTYLTYLYFLDPDANQVYRYPRSSLDESRRAEGGFGEMQNWLRSGADIKNAISFAINEDLFAAKESEIAAYLQGRKDEKIDFEKPNAPLMIDKIFSEPDMEGIYVLDGKNRRIVRYGKDGKIVAQYWNADISGVKDIVVDEKNKVVYLVKESKLLKFSME